MRKKKHIFVVLNTLFDCHIKNKVLHQPSLSVSAESAGG